MSQWTPSPFPVPGDIGEILITGEQIVDRVAAVGRQIAHDFRGEVPMVVGVLKGSVIFVADLIRAIDGPVQLDFLAVSSYGDQTKSTGVVRIIKDLDHEVTDRHVIIVEDIVDSGLTLRYLIEYMNARRPASVRTCTLLLREGDHTDDLDIDYVGFDIPPAFVVGYGLDAAQNYRNLGYIAEYTGS